jgi:peptidoglycan/xylan/chitin deacetylase (PgdA/CDA1 family)
VSKKKFLLILAVIFLLIDSALIVIKLNQNQSRIKPIHKEKPNYKYSVFLTSDDGPLKATPQLNQIVLDYEFPLTVFLVGRPMSQNSALKRGFFDYKKNPYVLIGNHSFTHANFHYKKYYSNPYGVIEDFQKNENYLGISSKIARFPGRNVWALGGVVKGERDAKPSALLLATDYGYKSFGWDYELRFFRSGEIRKGALYHYKRIKQLLKQGKTFTPNQIVILMHDQMFISKKSQEVLGELVLLLQNDSECKLKLLDEYKAPFRRKKLNDLWYVKAKNIEVQ